MIPPHGARRVQTASEVMLVLVRYGFDSIVSSGAWLVPNHRYMEFVILRLGDYVYGPIRQFLHDRILIYAWFGIHKLL